MKTKLSKATIYLIAAIFAICITACSDGEEGNPEPKEKVFTFAADGTPELIGNNGLDFNAIYDVFKGEFIDITSYRKYRINEDGSMDYIGASYFGSDTPRYPGGLNLAYLFLYWDEANLKLYNKGRWYWYDFLNYPINAEQEKTFFAKFKMSILGHLVKFADGKLGFVNKDTDGSWYFYDGVGAYNEYLKKKILDFIEKYGRQGGPIYDPEL